MEIKAEIKESPIIEQKFIRFSKKFSNFGRIFLKLNITFQQNIFLVRRALISG